MADEECKKEECPPGAPLWMCTFADLMSLLMCFFILLLSFSVMDAKKYKQVAGSMKDAFGVQRGKQATLSVTGSSMISKEMPEVPLNVQLRIAESLREEIDEGTVEADYGPDGLTLRVKDSLAFDSGQAIIKPRFTLILDKLGKTVVNKDVMVIVSGHTDNVPLRKSQTKYSSNWSLSTARSVAVVEYWIKRFKIPTERLSAMGYAGGQPLVSNDTAGGRARNRRVEFKIKPTRPNMVFDGIEFEKK
jgi:chemotaxis protein MotB